MGGRVHHQGEWTSRLQALFLWVKQLIEDHLLGQVPEAEGVVIFAHANPTGDHSEFFDPLSDFIRDRTEDKVPILYVNGDAHSFRYQEDFFGHSNFLRLQVQGGTRDPPLQVNVDATGVQQNAGDVFSFDRLL